MKASKTFELMASFFSGLLVTLVDRRDFAVEQDRQSMSGAIRAPT
jgi:hypothetical protein